ncbi:MAG: hypothetical protein ACLR76_12310, partial [Alistipes sp.]
TLSGTRSPEAKETGHAMQATQFFSSQDEFSEAHMNEYTRNIPYKTKRGGRRATTAPRNASGGPQSADYPIRVSPCQLI